MIQLSFQQRALGMPLFFTQHLRGLTLALFTLLDAEGEDIQALQQLFDRSEEKQNSIFTRDNAIHFLSRVGHRNTTNHTEFRNITCLDVAILKRKKKYVTWLAEKIFNHPTLRQNYKHDIFISAICICCATYQNRTLQYFIRSYTFDLNQANSHWEHNRSNLALNIAVSVGNEDAVSLLLAHRACKKQTDKIHCTAEHFLKNISSFEKRKKMREILHCGDYLVNALGFYQQNKRDKFQEYFIKAIKADVEQVYYYLLSITLPMFVQFKNPSNVPDYSMLLDFIHILMNIPVRSITYGERNRFELFQNTVISRLLHASDDNEALIGKINTIFPKIKLA